MHDSSFLRLIDCPRFVASSVLAVILASAAMSEGRAQQLGAGEPGAWGKAPEASDDRFSNPKSKLYAGPNGWYNSGEVRATLQGADKKEYAVKVSLHNTDGDYVAAKDLVTMMIKFGSPERPAAGEYTIGDQADPATKAVTLSFGDVSGGIKDWKSNAGAGVLTVAHIGDYTYVTCRNVTLAPNEMFNKGAAKNPMVLGFEGAVKADE